MAIIHTTETTIIGNTRHIMTDTETGETGECVASMGVTDDEAINYAKKELIKKLKRIKNSNN